MSTNQLNEVELAEILQIAQEGEQKLREMSDRATILAEKWRIKTQASDQSISTEPKITFEIS
jgi:hypothetical protein